MLVSGGSTAIGTDRLPHSVMARDHRSSFGARNSIQSRDVASTSGRSMNGRCLGIVTGYADFGHVSISRHSFVSAAR